MNEEYDFYGMGERHANVIETSQFSIADMEGSTKQYGVEGTRNNSYFGYKGTSYQTDSYGRYNEPKGRSK